MCAFAGPAITRSIASSSSVCSIWDLPARTARSAASLMTLASSAPEKPGVSLAISSSEETGDNGREPACS